MHFKCVLVFTSVFLSIISAKRLNTCELIKKLREQNFPEDKMRDWVCLIQNESGGRTDIISPPNKNRSKDHGLFQINDKYWCSDSSTPGKDCNVTCAQLRTPDITKAAKCAKKIYKRHGFNAWYGWKRHCQQPKPLPAGCP